ncbi:rSAM-modified peptide [Flavobacterium sp. FlaQc-47]
MKNYKIKLEDFETEKLSQTQQKAVRGGDGDEPEVDPTIKDGKGAGNH